ncbi:MAG TPA: T9SS type A sorting domain-containing protein [Saprospiraceae bacterium]|nr:T9SS type A sorting domain-containing protein [Saprospiraceae bacterium]
MMNFIPAFLLALAVDLVDISGTSHFSARIKNTVSTIPVDDLSPGLYFLRIVFDGRMVQVKKVVVGR